MRRHILHLPDRKLHQAVKIKVSLSLVLFVGITNSLCHRSKYVGASVIEYVGKGAQDGLILSFTQ